MSNEIAVIQAAREVCNTVDSMLIAYRSRRMITRQQKITLEEKIRAYRVIARNHAIGQVFNSTINELAKAQQLMDSMQFNEVGYEMAQQQYRILGEQLRRNLEEFSNGL